jgi:cytochrome b6-f complex iron-sulfur subunit
MTTRTISTESTPKINRREALYYLSGASLALFAAGTCGVVSLYAVPSIQSHFGVDLFEINVDDIPAIDAAPFRYRGREIGLWISHISEGLLALEPECVLEGRGIRVLWVDINQRFECPGCGSKYRLDGTWISGPASRGLDRYIMEVTTPHEIRITPEDGSPVDITDATRIVVDIRRCILGQPRD